LTTQNPARLARKLKARRMAAAKGEKLAAMGAGVQKKKKSNPLGGANQFHKKKGKKKKRR
jgi:hypothetical protein